jgi:antitoxin MazE
MKARIVRIGNSHGVRIPKPLLEQTGMTGEVELEVHADTIVIRRSGKPREGWAETFSAMAKRGDDALLDPEVIHSSFDVEEWDW